MTFMRLRRAIEMSALDRPWLGQLLMSRRPAPSSLDATYWDRQYQQGVFDRLHHSNQRHHHRLLAALIGETGDDRRFLEVGCGEGVFYRSLKPYNPASYLGVDISPEAIASAQETYAKEIAEGRLGFETAKAEDWTTSKRFDCIVFPECIEFMGDVAGVLKTYSAFLAPGGTMGVSMWLNADRVRRWWRIVETLDVIESAVVSSDWGGAWIVAHLRPKGGEGWSYAEGYCATTSHPISRILPAYDPDASTKK